MYKTVYVILRKKNGKRLAGTDFSTDPPTQRLSKDNFLAFRTWRDADREIDRRGCDRNAYKVAMMKVKA